MHDRSWFRIVAFGGLSIVAALSVGTTIDGWWVLFPLVALVCALFVVFTELMRS